MSELALPEGWVSTKLGNYVYLKNGYAFKSAEYLLQDNKNVPLIRIGDIQDNTVSTENSVFVKANEQAESFVINKGDLLIAMSGATTGKMGVYREDGKTYQNQRVGNIKFVSQSLRSESFRNYLIQSLKQTIYDIAYGGAQPNISAKAIENIEIALPPLNEQKVISQILNQYLTTVSQTQARLDAIPKLIEKFRQSVLNDAFNGSLTDDWRKNNSDIGGAFSNQAELNKFRTEELQKLPINWQWLKFEAVAEIASNLEDPKLTPKAIHLAPNHIASNKGKVIEISTIEDDNVKSAKHGFQKGQIIYSKIRPYLCKVVIAEFNGLCSADMYPINSKIETKYLWYWMLSAKFTHWASNAESRSVLPKINQKDLNKIPTPTAPIKEQKEIIRLIDLFFAHADQIEKNVAIAKARVDNLTQSILHQAFTGNLTAEWREQNPDLISGENSAEALLAKIEAEKKANKTKKKK